LTARFPKSKRPIDFNGRLGSQLTKVRMRGEDNNAAYETTQMTHGCALFPLYELHRMIMNKPHLVIPLLEHWFSRASMHISGRPPESHPASQTNQQRGSSNAWLQGSICLAIIASDKGRSTWFYAAKPNRSTGPKVYRGLGLCYQGSASMKSTQTIIYDVIVLVHVERLSGWPKAHAIRTDPFVGSLPIGKSSVKE
jgi:hypothetical protein